MVNLGRESETVEFKESTAEVDKACKAIVAMLNKAGEGTLYFGVKDNGDVVGQKIGKVTLSNLADKIKTSIVPSIYPTIRKMDIDERSIVCVAFSGTNKPYAYKGAFYIRVEQQNLILDPLKLREIIKQGHEYNEKWENELTDFTAKDIDEGSVDLFYRQAVAMGRINKFDHTSEELLVQLNLLKEGHLTNAGWYLFGKNKPLVYKAVEYATTERLNPIDLKRFEGNIFSLINQVINFINQKMRWKVEIRNVQRKEIPEIPVVAIREIVINSLVHSDFLADSEHQITIDPQCIEIYNPGAFGEFTPRDYVNQIIPSRTRHKVIQEIIFKAFDVETLGRGLKRMDKVCKEAKVTWDYRKYSFGFSFIFDRTKPNMDYENKDEELIILYMQKNEGSVSNIHAVMNLINKKERTAYKIMKALVEKKYIERKGSNKTGYWQLL